MFYFVVVTTIVAYTIMKETLFTTFCWIADGQPKDDNIPPPPLWREKHEYHTATVEEQIPDTNQGMKELEDTPANINVVLSSQAAQQTQHGAAPVQLSSNNSRLRQNRSSARAIKSCPSLIYEIVIVI